jgi:hypothetical protein
MTTIEAVPGVMEQPIVTVVGHATEAQTDHGRPIAVHSEPKTAAEIIVVGGMIPASAGVAAKVQQIPRLDAVTMAALELTRQMV